MTTRQQYNRTTEQKAGEGGLGEIGQDDAKRRGRHQSVCNVLQGGGPGGDTFWLIVLGSVGRNGENGGRGAHWFPAPNHGEVGAAEHGWDAGDTGGSGSTGSRKDTVGGHLHWSQTGDGGSVGGAAPYL